jgi:uncharacterized membrane protein
MRGDQGNNRGTLFPFVLAGLIGVSPATLLWPLLFPDQRGYFFTNQVGPDFPRQLLPYFLVSLLMVGAVYVHRFVRLSPRRLSDLVDTTRSCNAFLSILLVCPPIAALAVVSPKIESTAPFFTLLLIALVAAIGGAVGYRWTRSEAVSGDRVTSQRSWLVGLLAVAAASAGYAVAFSHFSILNLHHFNVSSWDLAIYDNLLWNTSHGRFLATSLVRGGTHMAAHFDPILVALTPLYLLSPRAETLLIIQSTWLASGAIPLYLISSRVLRGSGAGVVMAGAYLVHPALHGINLYEFHSLALVIPLVIWSLYFLERNHARGYWIALLLILLTREDMALLACGIGLFAADGFRRPRRGLTTIGCALLYLVLVRVFAMPEPDLFMSGKGDSYTYRYFFEQMIPYEGGGAREFLLTLVTNPIFTLRVVLEEAKLLYLALILLPCCFLSLFARRAWQLLGYGFVFCLLASDSGPHSIYKQYSSVLLPFAMVLAPYGLARLSGSGSVTALGLDPRRVRRSLLVGVAIAASLVSWKFGALVENHTFRVADWRRPIHFLPAERLTERRAQYEFVARAIGLIPPTASVSATRYLMPFISNRELARNYSPRLKTDYVLVRLKSLAEGRSLRDGWGAKFEAQRKGPEYEEVASGAGVVLLKRLIEPKSPD